MRIALAALLVLAFAAPSSALTLDGPRVQGGLVVGTAAPGATVRVDGRPVRVSPDGRFLVGFGREAPPTATLAVTYADGRTETRELSVAARTYPEQRIDGLPPAQVTPSPDDLARIRADAAAIAAVRARDSGRADFAGGFVWPARGPISGVFGSRRVLNGEPRSPHRGVDIAAPAGAPVVAAAPGIVALTHADMFFTGATVMIDHGHGLASVYVHLREIFVDEGERVAQGTPIGTVGASGRATGPHLHWGVSLFDVALDPALLVGPMPGEPAN